ncbi:MAG: cellulase family glycosylhydrolase [Ruminococcus sp.]|nr:cellulase family glycosylhydrolase [Ruminococcus sp.]
MKKYISAILAAAVMAVSFAGCGEKSSPAQSSSQAPSESSEAVTDVPDEAPQQETEPPTEAPTEHISPLETLSAQCAAQVSVDKTIGREEGSNTIQLPLADFIEEGDRISSFTFVIYSGDGSDIGTFKGGCGISVNGDCPSATDEGWFQSEDFSAPTQGTYGEIRWDVPGDIADYVSAGGDVLFGYWWGGAGSVRLDSVICTFDRTRQIPVDGTVTQNVGKSVSYSDKNPSLRVPTADFLPSGSVPQAITFNVSSTGSFGKFTGAFCYQSGEGYYQSPDTAVFTDSSSVSLTWFVPDEAKKYVAEDGEIVLGYWWSQQPGATLDSITVKYSLGSGAAAAAPAPAKTDDEPAQPSSTGFRSAKEIAGELKVGWNLGNTLDSYDTNKSGISTETGWGNPKTTEEMLLSVKNAGFNAVRIPVTWGEHMDGDTIQTEWLDRVQEVVDYAYNNGLYVILNMHHDDYIWFVPDDGQYAANSAKLKKIWEQICARFGDYGDRLLFEGMNEPRTVGSANEWMGGTAAERAVVNKYEQDFVDTVRASGGNNADRTLIVTTYGASAEAAAMNDLVIPDDGNIILSLHYYAPWRFANGDTTSFGDSEKSELDGKFSDINSRFVSKGVPVIIGEFGCVAKADDATRADYYRYYISSALSHGISCCFIWDNGVAAGKDGYAMLNRYTLTWNDTILPAIMEGAK